MTKRRRINATASRERRIMQLQLDEGYVKQRADGSFVLLCACGCGTELPPGRPVIREHLHALELGGPDTPENIRLYYRTCADRKTNGTGATSYGSDKHAIAKCKRLAGETGNRKY